MKFIVEIKNSCGDLTEEQQKYLRQTMTHTEQECNLLRPDMRMHVNEVEE